MSRTVAALIALGLLVGCSGSDASDDGAIDVADLKTGQCVSAASADVFVRAFEGGPCLEPHAMEVAGSYDLDDGEYPGVTALVLSSQRDCIPIYERYTGADFWDSPWDVKPIIPSPVSWREGDRRVICMVVDLDGEPLTESVRRAL